MHWLCVFDVINEKINSKIENEHRNRHTHRKHVLNAQNIQDESKFNKSEKNAVNEAKAPLG